MRSLVVVPTYNEAENISPLLSAIRAEVPTAEILVVDDSSPDGTGKIVTQIASHQPGIHLLTRAEKQGLSAAYQAGFAWALARDYDAIVQMDADFSHRPVDLSSLLKALGPADVVIGCRYMDGAGTVGWPFWREWISRGGNTYARVLLGLPLKDVTGGFTAWRKSALQQVLKTPIRSKGYAFQVELKNRAHSLGLGIIEVPIQFDNRKFGYSKMSGRIVWEAAFRVFEMRRTPTA